MRPILRLLLLLQLEHYESIRFLRSVLQNPAFLFVGSSRQCIDWTAKMRAILFVLALFLVAGFGAFVVGTVFFEISIVITVLGSVLLITLMPIWIVCANILLLPLDRFLKYRLIRSTRLKIQHMKARWMRVIAIAGSYGKTTQKHILAHMLASSHDVLWSEENFNTPLGVKQLFSGLESDRIPDIAIIEMGEHYRGDIRELAHLVRPDISIVTGITHQHLERMGTIDAIIDTIFELPLSLDAADACHFHTESEYVRTWLERYGSDIRAQIVECDAHIAYEPLEDFSGSRFVIDGLALQTPLLGEHLWPAFAIAVRIARSLGVDDADIHNAVKSIPFVAHRLAVMRNPAANLTIIDDSYNGNVEGFRAAAKIMRDTPKPAGAILVTPWLVELWSDALRIHHLLGAEIADAYDRVILIDNSSTRALARWLEDAGFSRECIHFYPDATSAHASLPEHIHDADTTIFQRGRGTIVFQNDWTDNY